MTPTDHLVTQLSLEHIKIVKPPDGLPSIGDFITTVISFIHNGSRLHREPLDISHKGSLDNGGQFKLKKGFTRLTLGSLFQTLTQPEDCSITALVHRE